MSVQSLTARLPPDRMECRFHDFKPGLNDFEAREEADRCLNCYEAPCVAACPTHIEIPQFIGRIASGHVSGAAKTILESNILGLSCARSCPVEVLCEGSCVYHELDSKPIAIGKLQRHAVEKAYEAGLSFFKPGHPTGKRVALVGAGPATLACAHELRRLGHEALIYERSELPGGLNTTGIAPYKMKAETSFREVAEIERMGAKIHYGYTLGDNLLLDQLLKVNDAIFLGLGLGQDSRIEVPGIELPAIEGAVSFIAKLKSTPSSELERLRLVTTALVVGGGNTALDASRELKGLGIPRVVMSYRRTEAEMSGYAHERIAARLEGVEFWFKSLPVAFVKTDTGVRVHFNDEQRSLDAQLVLLATGQAKLEAILQDIAGLRFEAGCLVTDSDGRTGNPRIYAGGDLTNGGKEVVNAVAEGKRAAIAMDRELLGGCRG